MYRIAAPNVPFNGALHKKMVEAARTGHTASHGLIAGACKGARWRPPDFPHSSDPMPILRRGLPMALTIAVHLLLAVCWYLARRDLPPAVQGTPQRFLVMLNARPVPPADPPQAAPVARRATPARAPRRTVLSEPAAIETIANPMDAPAETPAAPAPGGADTLASAKRDAGKIDRALRGGVTPPLSADSPRARFEAAMASAWIDRSNTMVVDRYTSPDGVVIERVTRRGHRACYMSGTVNFVPGILHDSSKPQSVNCPPAGGGWTRK